MKNIQINKTDVITAAIAVFIFGYSLSFINSIFNAASASLAWHNFTHFLVGMACISVSLISYHSSHIIISGLTLGGAIIAWLLTDTGGALS